MPGGSVLAMHHCKRFDLDAVQQKNTSISGKVHRYAYPVCYYVVIVCEIKIMVINFIAENQCGQLRRN